MTTHAHRSCVVHGPSGCGKTTKAHVIARALGLDLSVAQREAV
ncbi:AAA family ATPase [Pseudomonas sp. 51_B]|nr:AAA family ATPase [Pseudomonas sp. 51_B]